MENNNQLYRLVKLSSGNLPNPSVKVFVRGYNTTSSLYIRKEYNVLQKCYFINFYDDNQLLSRFPEGNSELRLIEYLEPISTPQPGREDILLDALKNVFDKVNFFCFYNDYKDNEAACKMAVAINEAKEIIAKAQATYQSLPSGEQGESQDELWDNIETALTENSDIDAVKRDLKNNYHITKKK